MMRQVIKGGVVVAMLSLVPVLAMAELTFQHTITGETLDLSKANPEGRDTPAVKQCALSCAEAKDGCPSGLACFEGPQTRSSEGAEPAPAFAWCQ